MSLLALAVSVAVAASVAASAAQIGPLPPAFREAALISPAPDLGTTNGPRDVIAPPSSVDPGMAIDPPEVGAKMPVIHPQPTPGGGMMMPR
jgi:hypothetical protein